MLDLEASDYSEFEKADLSESSFHDPSPHKPDPGANFADLGFNHSFKLHLVLLSNLKFLQYQTKLII